MFSKLGQTLTTKTGMTLVGYILAAVAMIYEGELDWKGGGMAILLAVAGIFLRNSNEKQSADLEAIKAKLGAVTKP